MLADLDDGQRADLAHEHPTDLHSSPSSQSSGIPAFLEPRHRPKQRSHAADESGSSHLLARLVDREEEVREVNAALAVSAERLEAESTRANAAERRALDYFHRLRIATENRERAEHESARLREELRLYKLQLDNAQKEIFRAQDIIDQVASQRNEAEADAARARTKARRLQEEKLVMLAREEGRRMGYKEGLSVGRRIGYDQDDHSGESTPREHDEITDDEPRARMQLRSAASMRQHPMRPGSAPPVRTYDPPLPVPSRVSSARAPTPSHDPPPHGPDEPETIHPIPVRPSPSSAAHHVSVPPEGWIPRADSRTSFILVPPPHELQQPVGTSPSSVVTDFQDNRPLQQQEPDPTPIPPVRSRDYAYQVHVPPPPPIQIARTSSLASRSSTHISQYDLVNKRPGSALRNEIYVGRPRSGSQPSRESLSRNEHRDQERRYSDRTEAESIVEQWRADSDAASPPRNPVRSSTPSARPHRPAHFYYRPREIATPTPLGDVGPDPRSRTPAPVEPTPQPTSPPPDDPAASQPSHVRTPFEYLRQRFRQRPSSGSTIPNIVVESPSEPETVISPSATIAGLAAQPELLSPEAANRPLPQEDVHHDHDHDHPQRSQPPSQPPSRPEPPSHHPARRRSSSSAYDVPRSGTPAQAWPSGFVPYGAAPAGSHGASSRSRSGSGAGAYPHGPYVPGGGSARGGSYGGASGGAYGGWYGGAYGGASGSASGSTSAGPGPGRARTVSASGAYEAAPLPPGVSYPAPPVRPQTSHRRYKDREREREWEGARDGEREYWDRERERDRDRDRTRDRGEKRRGYDRRARERDTDREEEDGETGVDEALTRSPAPLQRPISLFDSDEG